MKKDWIGTTQSTMTCIGARNFAVNERENGDYYATEPKAVRLLLEMENFPKNRTIWECACGGGHLSEEMKRLGYGVYSTDYYDRGYGEICDFVGLENTKPTEFNIITNPPYRLVNDFIVRGNMILKEGNKMALFLPIRYLEGKERKEIYRRYPPKVVFISSGQLKCAIGGNFEKMCGNAVSYAWFVWQKGYKGESVLRWFN